MTRIFRTHKMWWELPMRLVQINADTTGLTGLATLRAALDTLPDGAPVVVMVHGYKFTPRHPRRSPHTHILSLAPDPTDRKALSWPRQLGLGQAGLAIAFGWEATGSVWRAWAEAARAGLALARLLTLLHAEGRRADLVAHSMGARVALAALAALPVPALRRAILIAPAEFRDTARAALDTPAGLAAEIVNVISRENDLFDALVEWLVAPHRPGARTLGLGLGADRPNWTDLQVDDSATLAALATLGYRIAAPTRRICHWSGYLRPGVFPLYRAIVTGALPLPLLRDHLPGRAAPRWSRLLDMPALPLPFARKAAS